MGRSPCCDENGLKKGPWTPEEDKQLVQYIQKHGHGSWRALPKLAGLNRCGKSCRLRWTNYLRPDIKRGKFSADEEKTILNLHSILGNKWSAIATHLPGRTDNEIKNFWNTHLKKKLIQMGFDPMTHRPRTDIFSSLPHLIALANLKELMDQYHPWEEQTTKLQEALQLAKAQCLQQILLQSAASMSNNPNACLNGIVNNTDMDAINLLNSTSYSSPPKVDPMNNIFSNTSGHLESTTTSTSIGFASQLANDHSQQLYINPQQDLHEYNYDQTPMSSEMNQIPNILDAFSRGEIALKSSPMVGHDLEPVAENNLVSNPSDIACNVASYPGNASSFWPDQLLLEEPFIHDFALS